MFYNICCCLYNIASSFNVFIDNEIVFVVLSIYNLKFKKYWGKKT